MGRPGLWSGMRAEESGNDEGQEARTSTIKDVD